MRLTALALAAGVVLAGMAAFAQQSQPGAMRGMMRMRKATVARHMKIMVDGKMMRPATPPLMMNGRVMLPMRSVFEQLGASVNWNASRREVMATKGDRRMTLRVGDRDADVNGRMTALDVAPMMYRNSVYVPLRAVSEALGASVAYNSSRREVAITTAGRPVAAAPRMMAGLPREARVIEGGAILVNGARLKTTAEPVMLGTAVLVPAQVVFEELKAQPTWNPSQHRLTAIHAGQRIVVIAGDRNAMIGTRTERLSHAPFVHNDQVYVPLDFIGRAVGGTATWEASRKEVVINTQARPVG